MKRFLTLALAVASVGVIGIGTASAFDLTATTYSVGDGANGIGQSRHNLGSLGEHMMTSKTTEICVFCHTPHHTNSVGGPIWNRSTQANTAFTAYGSTLGGSSIANTDIGPTTLACLSCHDGTTTFDNLANRPGKGTGSFNWNFFEGGVQVSDWITSSRLNIGMSLSNDHPISVVYVADRAGLRPTTTTISGIDLTGDLKGSSATYDGANLLSNLWAVKGYISDTATIADLLRSGKVECSSCHDPHFNNKSWQEVDYTYTASGVTDDAEEHVETNGLFLRRVGGNTGSGLCRTCHNK